MENNRHAEIINAWNEGKTIQYKNGENWDDITEDGSNYLLYCLSGNLNNLRIKPEKKLRPYENINEFLSDLKEHGPLLFHKSSLWYRSIKAVHERFKGIYLNCETDNNISMQQLLSDFKWQDGADCGILEEN